MLLSGVDEVLHVGYHKQELPVNSFVNGKVSIAHTARIKCTIASCYFYADRVVHLRVVVSPEINLEVKGRTKSISHFI